MKKFFLFCFTALAAYSNVLGQENVTVQTKPATIYVERGESRQLVNFDFILQNNSSDTLTLVSITVNVLDATNKVMHARFLDNNGTAPSIQTLPERTIPVGQSLLLFNPLSEFNLNLDVSQMKYILVFQNQNRDEQTFSVNISPKPYKQAIAYSFPLKGKILVYDGHEYHAHHRRFNYEFAPIKGLGIRSNFMRYAYDFVHLDESNNQYTGENTSENYASYGAAVFAIADGEVIYASNKHADDRQFSIPEIANNPLELYGNCVAIKHADNSISLYGHLKQNSLKVAVGDQVKGQMEIGAIGLSGSAFFPHLHFEMRTALDHSAEGLPSYFSNVAIVEGATTKLKSGLVETGSVLIAK